jgi:hypothetical protein
MNCVIDLNKPCVSETEILDIAIGFLFDGRQALSFRKRSSRSFTSFVVTEW